MRKITCGNNSESGARNHETLMTLVETSKLHQTNLRDLMMGFATSMDLDGLNHSIFGPTWPGTGPPPDSHVSQ